MIDILKKRYKIINLDGRSNYHTHTYYCDGKNSPEEMVEQAIKLGFRSLGFSGHQYSDPDKDYAMTEEKESKYRSDIIGLKEKYNDKINIFLGTERDYFSDESSEFEYIIGSAHHLLVKNHTRATYPRKIEDDKTEESNGSRNSHNSDDSLLNMVDVDWSPEIVDKQVKDFFDGDYMAYAEAYYDFESNVLEKTRGQIVGHFDLITVFNGAGVDDIVMSNPSELADVVMPGGEVSGDLKNGKFRVNTFFDENDSAYKSFALRSAERIVEQFINNNRAKKLPKGFPEELGEVIDKTGLPIFEINTGAMAKGRRSIPYPAPFIIEHLAELGVPMIINSDCHDLRFLDYGFKELWEKYNA